MIEDEIKEVMNESINDWLRLEKEALKEEKRNFTEIIGGISKKSTPEEFGEESYVITREPHGNLVIKFHERWKSVGVITEDEYRLAKEGKISYASLAYDAVGLIGTRIANRLKDKVLFCNSGIVKDKIVVNCLTKDKKLIEVEREVD